MQLLSPKQAAAVLNLSPVTLAKWRCAGGGPRFVRYTSRCIRYQLADLDQWVAARFAAHTSEPGYAAA